MSERLERVTDWSELRAGMVVVVMNCDACGKAKCRGMCIELLPASDEYDVPAWEVIPPCKLAPGSDCNTIDPITVETGDVFRVLDGLEEPSTETAAATGTTRRTPQKETTDVR